MIPTIWVMSRMQAGCFTPPPNCVAISIREATSWGPNCPMHPAELHDDFVEVLHLAFDDADKESAWGPPGRDVIFSVKQAKQILEFIKEHQDADGLMIHCYAGISRSAGVALGIMDAFKMEIPWSMEKQFPNHNRHVRTTLRNAAEREEEGGDDPKLAHDAWDGGFAENH